MHKFAINEMSKKYSNANSRKNWNWDFSELFLKNKYIFLQNIDKMIY